MFSKNPWVVVAIGGFVIVLLTFGKLAWVAYFGTSLRGEPVSLVAILSDALPLFLLAVVGGILIAWLRTPKD